MTLTRLPRQDISQNSYFFPHNQRLQSYTATTSCLPVYPDTKAVRKASWLMPLTLHPAAPRRSSKDTPTKPLNQVLHQGAPYGSFSPCGFLCSPSCFLGPKELSPSSGSCILLPQPKLTVWGWVFEWTGRTLKHAQLVATSRVHPAHMPGWLSYGRK